MTSSNSLSKELNELQDKFSDLDKIFDSEPSVVKIKKESAIVVGDIHGNLEALQFILKTKEELGIDTIIFLGDYIDRGPKSIKILNCLFNLKLEMPGDFILLRGNHETADVNRYYGLFYDLRGDEELFIKLNNIFDKLPLAAIVSNSIFCVHGGIPEFSIIESITKEDYFPYVWNDPSENKGMNYSNRGNNIHTFGNDVVLNFLAKNNLKQIIRGHEVVLNGYKWWFGNKLVSIYSCPNYGKKENGALAIIDKDKLKIMTFEPLRAG